MDDQKLKNAKNFFVSSKANVQADSEFKAQLKSQVFQNYLSITNDSMEDQKKSFFGKKSLLGAMAFSLIAVIAIGGYYFGYNPNTTKTAKDQKIGAAVAYFEGDLEIQNADGGWNDATIETTLVEGNNLRVRGEGRAIINFDDGSSARLNSNSQIFLVRLDPEMMSVANIEGDVYVRVVKLDREFNVVAGDVQYNSLGTAYNTVNKKEIKGVEVYQSKVSVKVKGEEKVKVDEGKKYYFTNDKDKNNVEKVTSISKEILTKDEFIKWNKELDQKDFSNELGFFKDDVKGTETKTETKVETKTEPAPAPTPQPAPTPAPTGSITITQIMAIDGAFKVFWSSANVDTSGGFKVVYNTTGNPSYPYDNPNYVGAGSTYHAIGGLSSGTYYVRVCRYTGSGCDTYSNEVSVSVTAAPPATPISSITLSSTGGTAVAWNTNGGTASQGFKLVWSKNPDPTYTNGVPYDFAGFYEPHKTTGDISWGSNAGPGLYYVRVCEYLNGSCAVHSNPIQVTIP